MYNLYKKDLKSLVFGYRNSTTYFGSETRQALIDFQRTFNLKVDGIAGAETVKALNSNKRKPKSSANRGGSRNSSRGGESIVATAKKNTLVLHIHMVALVQNPLIVQDLHIIYIVNTI